MQPHPASRYYGQSANYGHHSSSHHSSSFGRRSKPPTYVHHSYDPRDRVDYDPPSEHDFDVEPVGGEKDPGFYHVGDRYYYEPPDGSTPAHSANGKPLGATHVVVEHKNKKSSCCMWIMTALLILVSIILVICIILFFMFGRPFAQVNTEPFGGQFQSAYVQPRFDHVVTPSYVLTAVITKRKICLMDATGSGRSYNDNRKMFAKEHIKGAHWFDFTNVTNAQATKFKELVHPLVFQSYVRELGVDKDCHVVFYDRGDDETYSVKWATYGYWLFRVFGHSKVSIMQGGLRLWQTLQQQNAEYATETGADTAPAREGNFEAQWSSQYIATYPDVVANFDTGTSRETREYLVIDARTPEEFKGAKWDKMAVGGGHIKDAINIPIASVYDDVATAFKNKTDLVEFFTNSSVSYSQPVMVYCSTAVRASVVWFALQMINYPSKIYDGSWVEWSLLAPEALKVTPTPPTIK